MVQSWLSVVLSFLAVLVVPCGMGLWRLSLSVALMKERQEQHEKDLDQAEADLKAEVGNGLKRDASISAIDSRLSSIEGKLDMIIRKIS